MNTILTTLPLEIIDHILTYLSTPDLLSCLSTCKKWYIQFYYCMIRTVHITNRRQIRSLLSQLYRYPAAGQELKSIYFKSRVGLTPYEFATLTRTCPNLEVFKFSSWQNYTSSFRSTAKLRQIPKLHHKEKGLHAISKVGNTLTHLELSEYILRKLVPSGDHFLLLNYTPNLTHLTLDGVFSPDPARSGVKRMEFTDRDWHALHLFCPYLTFIQMTHANLTTVTIHGKSEYQQHLKHLILKELHINDPIWLYLFAFMYKNLVELELGFGLGTFVKYSEAADRLERIDCQVAFLVLAHKLHHLKKLTLTGLKSSHFIGKLFFHFLATKGNTQLDQVSLRYETDPASLPGINIDTFEAVLESQCRTLTTLEIELPRGMTYENNFNTILLALRQCRRIKKLTLHNDDLQTFNYISIPLDRLLDACPFLTELILSRIVTHINNKETMQNKHPLTKLDLSNSRVSQLLFEYLTVRCPLIHHLTLFSCCWMPRELEMQINMPNNTFSYLRIVDMNRRKTVGLEGNLVRGDTINLFSVTQLDKIAKLEARYQSKNVAMPDSLSKYYYLYDPEPVSTRYFFPPSIIRKLDNDEVKIFQLMMEYYKANAHTTKIRHFQEYENRYLGKKQWKFDVASGFIHITCKSIYTLKYNYNIMTYK